MSERKYIQKYYKHDYDYEEIEKPQPSKQFSYTCVRLATPFNMKCLNCGEYIFKGRKHNAKKEEAVGEDYLGVPVYRFYIKCTSCRKELTFKTDPKNGDYVSEFGCKKLTEVWDDKKAEKDNQRKMMKEQERKDAMLAVENRAIENQEEERLNNELYELRKNLSIINSRNVNDIKKEYELKRFSNGKNSFFKKKKELLESKKFLN